ncbi:DUF5994 family protein [Streptomyces sp. NBC_01190]|uniref:DUF5994 family protein n=1 Tax=Streptomyces sp. NBC_01190 TaxID=2903767 RepID=UPI003869E948|nr:DUF5994 family protein [Streptomyces sp. NBC_01190]
MSPSTLPTPHGPTTVVTSAAAAPVRRAPGAEAGPSGDDGLTARLSLTAASTGPGAPMPGHAPLDGAWWPRSRDLFRELPPLIMALESRWPRVTRVAVNPTYWPVVPKKVPVPGGLLHVGWFGPEQDPNQLLLLGSRVGRWDLLVIPPQTPEETAVRLMAAASDPANTLRAGALIARMDTRRAELAA